MPCGGRRQLMVTWISGALHRERVNFGPFSCRYRQTGEPWLRRAQLLKPSVHFERTVLPRRAKLCQTSASKGPTPPTTQPWGGVWNDSQHRAHLRMDSMSYVSAPVRRQQIVEAARRVMARDGVADASLRSVAAEAGVPLGTMQHAFKTKRELLQAVVDDVNAEIAEVLGRSPSTDGGLAHVISRNLTTFWADLVDGHSSLQLMQYELTTYSLRSAGAERLASWQYRQYSSSVASWCEQAAVQAGETTTVPFDQLARIIVAGLDGLILQHLCDPDEARSSRDLKAFIEMVVGLADAHPTP